MAIAFVRAKIIGRSAGQSAVACAAYRSGEKLHDDRYGKTHDYQRKEGIMATGLVVAEDAPTWAKNRNSLWNAVEAMENRKDAQVARELIVAIPCELPQADQVQLTEDIARHLAAMGMGVDWALHRPSKEGDDRNIHAHLMLTTREITADGFGSKAKDSRAREWNSDKWLNDTKRQIEKMYNARLVEKGYEPVSFEERKGQGAEHDGPTITGIKRRANREVQNIADEGNRELAKIDEQIKREIDLMHQEREAEREAAKAKKNPLELLAEVTEQARRGGPQELAAAYKQLVEVRRLAGERAGEYPEIGEAARRLKTVAGKQGLIYDAKKGQVRAMTRREIEEREDRGR